LAKDLNDKAKIAIEQLAGIILSEKSNINPEN